MGHVCLGASLLRSRGSSCLQEAARSSSAALCPLRGLAQQPGRGSPSALHAERGHWPGAELRQWPQAACSSGSAGVPRGPRPVCVLLCVSVRWNSRYLSASRLAWLWTRMTRASQGVLDFPCLKTEGPGSGGPLGLKRTGPARAGCGVTGGSAANQPAGEVCSCPPPDTCGPLLALPSLSLHVYLINLPCQQELRCAASSPNAKVVPTCRAINQDGETICLQESRRAPWRR